jgi:hypothetical protein
MTFTEMKAAKEVKNLTNQVMTKLDQITTQMARTPQQVTHDQASNRPPNTSTGFWEINNEELARNNEETARNKEETARSQNETNAPGSYAAAASQGVKSSELGRIVMMACTEQAKEEQERQSRETNIIIHRAPESKSRLSRERTTYDQQYFDELCCNVLDIDDESKEITRLGKPEEGKNRPLRITLGSKEEAIKIHERTRNLRYAEDEYKNIIITHDLTPDQRAELRMLAEEAKQKTYRL